MVCTVQDMMHFIYWHILDHPPCNPELPLCGGSRVFGTLRKALKAQRLSSDKDTGVVARWLQQQQQSRNFSVEGFLVWCISGIPVTTPAETTVNGLYKVVQI
jgi:hypothetical protein